MCVSNFSQFTRGATLTASCSLLQHLFFKAYKRETAGMWTQQLSYFLLCLVPLPSSQSHTHTYTCLERTHTAACAWMWVCTLSPSAVKCGQTSLTGWKKRDRKRGRQWQRGREGKEGRISATETPPCRFMACVCMHVWVCVCVLNEFWELSSLYDSCNWPEDSCYYTLQQGNGVGNVCVCVWETLWSCTCVLE